MEETKPDVSQMEIAPETHNLHHSITALAENEDEPQSPYQLGWRTILALLTLSMGNVCAALSNTVSPQAPHHRPFTNWSKTNTTIKFQVATVAHSASDAALAPWVANGNFLLTLAIGPIFVRLSSPHFQYSSNQPRAHSPIAWAKNGFSSAAPHLV